MDSKTPEILISEADRLLNFADKEMQRAEEDVATYTVCVNSRQSIINYLISFLMKNGEEPTKPVSLASLMNQCRSIDGRFDLIDTSPIYCSHDEDDEEFCLDVQKVDECIKVAKQTRAIALNESPAY